VTRRAFMTLLAAAAWPLAARAQQPGVALVGLLVGSRLDDRELEAVRQGLKEAGYIEGRNIAIKYRSADGRFERLPALAAALVADPVAVILTFGPGAARRANVALTNTARNSPVSRVMLSMRRARSVVEASFAFPNCSSSASTLSRGSVIEATSMAVRVRVNGCGVEISDHRTAARAPLAATPPQRRR
jgi:hypothetical protein